MAKMACKILGIVLVLAGIVGFFAHDLLGLHLTPAHNCIHLLTGTLAIYFGFAETSEAAHMFSRVFSVIYLLGGILGFINPGAMEKILQIQTVVEGVNLAPDNVVHMVLGAVFLIVGFLPEPQTAAPTESKA